MIHAGRMRKPRIALQFILQLPRSPAGVAGKNPNLGRGRKRIANLQQFIDGMLEIQIWDDIGVRQIIFRMQKTHYLPLHRPANRQVLFLNTLWQILHDHLSHRLIHRPIQHQSEGPLLVVLAQQDHRAVEE